MVNEIFDILDVKNEYVNGIGKAVKEQFTIQNIEAAFVLLNDFCMNMRANGLVLIRIQEPPIIVEPPKPQTIPRIKSDDMSKKIAELNRTIQEPPPQLREDINLEPHKPKSFVEKVKSYKLQTTSINDDEDEE